MHNCTLSAASGPLHYDKGRRPERARLPKERERERERERQHSFDDDNEGSSRLECALVARSPEWR